MMAKDFPPLELMTLDMLDLQTYCCPVAVVPLKRSGRLGDICLHLLLEALRNQHRLLPTSLTFGISTSLPKSLTAKSAVVLATRNLFATSETVLPAGAASTILWWRASMIHVCTINSIIYPEGVPLNLRTKFLLLPLTYFRLAWTHLQGVARILADPVCE